MNTNNYMLYAIIGMVLVVGGLALLTFTIGNGTTSSMLRQKLQAVYDSIPTQSGKTNFLKQSQNLTQNVNPELIDLDSQIITCSANIDSLLSNTPTVGGSCVGGETTLSSVKGKFLGGQCCGAMKDTKKYHEQLKKLQAYKNIPDIPLNPYKTPIALAKKWIDFNKNTTLSPQQQKIMDKAMKLSKEGPCCCKCWHYYVNEGIAKKMIQDKGWDAKQVADFWDNSSIC